MAELITLDSSIVAKWFRSGEEFEEEALRLRREVLSSKVSASASELLPLEVCRALVKVGYPSGKIREAYATLSEMSELGFLELVPTAMLRDVAKDAMVELNLYVADALTLAAAIINSSDLLTEDRHLLKQEVKRFMGKKGLTVIPLKEIYGV
ncbi:MAG: type II toxin-antitoxin system VapC family toxin [Candidatus Bathyarchaeia archaeon]